MLLVTAYFAWPRTNKDNDNVMEDMKLEGDNNDIKTEQDKEYALIHIENRIKAETGSHLTNIRESATTTRWLTWGTMGVVGVLIVGYFVVYRMIQLPKRSTQWEMQDRHADQIETIQDTLIAHGYMPAPKRSKKNRRKAKAKKNQGRRQE